MIEYFTSGNAVESDPVKENYYSLYAAIIEQMSNDYAQALRGRFLHTGTGAKPVAPETTMAQIKLFFKKDDLINQFVSFEDFEMAAKRRANYYEWRDKHHCKICHHDCPYTKGTGNYSIDIDYKCMKDGLYYGKADKGTNETCE